MNIRLRLLDEIVRHPKYVDAPYEIELVITAEELPEFLESLHPSERFCSKVDSRVWYFPLAGYTHLYWPKVWVRG